MFQRSDSKLWAVAACSSQILVFVESYKEGTQRRGMHSYIFVCYFTSW